MRFLIIDDEKILAQSIAEVLSELGFETETAFDGAQALEKIQNKEFDIIISDIDMPYLNGIEFGLGLRRLGQMTKIIYMSGNMEENQRKYSNELKEILPLKVIEKPYIFTNLISLVNGASIIKEEFGTL